MVDLALLQSVSYIAGALGVCVAAFYYLMTLRETNKKRRVDFAINLNNFMNAEEAMLRFRELMNMDYNDYADFEHKYGSDTNPDNFAKRQSAWWSFNTLGHLLRIGNIDAETVYSLNGETAIWVWEKTKDLIIEARKRYNGKDFMLDFEYLSQQMLWIKKKNDPDFQVPKTFSRYVENNQSP
jgi:hypothetical protein